MSHHPETPAVLRERGLRITPQRMIILDILQHSDRHLSADEIFGALQQRLPSTDISTVYRTLELLTNLGMLQKVNLGEAHDHYEWADDPHYHIVCQQCGAVFHCGPEVLDPLRDLLKERYQFRLGRASLEVFGICARCDEAGSEPGRASGPAHQH